MIRDLSTARQQVVEIVKAMSYKSKIIIMDEPTASLTQKEIDHLFKPDQADEERRNQHHLYLTSL